MAKRRRRGLGPGTQSDPASGALRVAGEGGLAMSVLQGATSTGRSQLQSAHHAGCLRYSNEHATICGLPSQHVRRVLGF
eukprot:scaffold4518_cov410-Prasinococcus_capsulatus_cf.AAC.4